MSLAGKLKKWVDNHLIDQSQADSILAFEANKGRSRIFMGLGGLGVLSIVLGFASIVAANWYAISPEVKIAGHTGINLLVAFMIMTYFQKPSWVREALVSLLAGLLMTFIALIGQILQTQAPMWQPLGFWLLLATPMLLMYGRHLGIVAVWLGILGWFSASLANETLTETQSEVFWAALPFFLYSVFNIERVGALLPNWKGAIDNVFWSGLVVVTSLMQLLWHCGTAESCWRHLPNTALVVFGIGVLFVFLMGVVRRNSYALFWKAGSDTGLALLLVSFGFSALPLVVPHGGSEVLGAVMFCLYWLFIGAVGIRLKNDQLWSVAVVLVGVRIFAAYVEIMGSLALQGFGFIVTGLLFLGMAYIVRKIIGSREALGLILNNPGSQP